MKIPIENLKVGPKSIKHSNIYLTVSINYDIIIKSFVKYYIINKCQKIK